MTFNSESTPTNSMSQIESGQIATPEYGTNFERDERNLIEELARSTGRTPEEVIENNRITALRAGVLALDPFSDEARINLLTEHLREVQLRGKSTTR